MKIYEFKTNVFRLKDQLNLSNILGHYFRIASAVFDHKTLKIQAQYLSPVKVENAMKDLGYSCKHIE